MFSFTCVTTNRSITHLSQHTVSTPEEAFKNHISEMPFIEGINPIGDELYWLQSISLGKSNATLIPVTGCKGVWKWQEGERYVHPYVTFIIKTDIRN